MPTAPAEPLWRGIAAALVTLFTPDGAVDSAATAAHAARLVDLGVRGLLVAGTTGEADALSDAERVELIAAVKGACPTVPVVAGTSGAWSRPAAERVAAAVKAGADAVLVAPPRRCLDLPAFYAAVAAAGPAPLLGYHFPGVAGGEIPVDALSDLPLAGIKDSTGDAERLLAELAGWNGWTYVGSAVLTGYAGALGAAGAILAIANAVPEECAAAWDGDMAAQRRMFAAHRAAKTRFPHGLKSLIADRFDASTVARLG